jgi:lysozyme
MEEGNKKKRRFGWIIIAAVVCIVMVIGLASLWLMYRGREYDKNWPQHDLTSGPYSTGYDGIDISVNQGRIRWDEMKGKKIPRFIYVKATEGVTHKDACYDRNIAGARKRGIAFGSYHFFRKRDGAQQAKNFIKVVDRKKQDLLPVVDCEELGGTQGWSKAKIQSNLRAFIVTCTRAFGKKPIIYCSESYYKDYLSPSFDDCILFIAKYHMNQPVLPGKAHYTIWQYYDHGRVPGIYNWVDLDRFAPSANLKDIAYH